MNELTIIEKPILTEKVTQLRENNNIVVFKVHRSANKIQIGVAMKKLFNVTPVKVSIINVKPKEQRLGRHVGKKAGWKKAIITLKKDDKIDYFEGA